jgi:CHAD domain-containing protein
MTAVRSARPPGSVALDLTALHELLASSFQVSAGRRRLVRHTALDTFDRRLDRAGQRLELVAEDGDERLELTLPGQTLAEMLTGTGPRWPAMAAALPDGPLKDHVARLAKNRALLVVGESRRLVGRAELRNADSKIVVRIDVDEPADDGAEPPTTVTVRPLRGYQKEADRAWRLITTLLEPVTAEPVVPPSESAWAVDPRAPARSLLAAELTRFLAEMRDNLPGTIADIDTEFLHDVRVAVRRTRSLLKLSRPALPPHFRDGWEPRFKWLGDLTTPVRDLDVYQLGLPEMAGWLVAAAAADLKPFEAHLARRRAAERRALVRALRGARLRRLLEEWTEELVELAGSVLSADGAAWSAGALARVTIARAHRRVLRSGTAISDASPPEDLHVLRKQCKELRYALEIFAPVLGEAQVRQAIKDLKSLQDVLGRFQDSEVQWTTLRGFAHEMVADRAPAGALLAMGELTGHLHAEQQRARAEFAGVFASYVRPDNRRRMARLLGGGGKAAE